MLPPERWRPLVVRTSGNAREGVYGLILALSVVAVARGAGHPDASDVAWEELVTALVFWLAHAYADVLSIGLKREHGVNASVIARTLRVHWSLVEVTIPLLITLGLGAAGVFSDSTAVTLVIVIALWELAGAGAYAAKGNSLLRVLLSAAVSAGLGLAIVALKALLH